MSNSLEPSQNLPPNVNFTCQKNRFKRSSFEKILLIVILLLILIGGGIGIWQIVLASKRNHQVDQMLHNKNPDGIKYPYGYGKNKIKG